MNPFYDTELYPSAALAEPIDKESVSGDNGTVSAIGSGKKISPGAAVLAVAAVGILTIPFAALLLMRANRPIFIGTQSRPANNGSAVLAVDTFGLTIRSQNASAPLKELFERAAMEHLARLHRTYSRWANMNQELMGSLLLKLTVDATGTVVSVDSLASHVTNERFTKTVMADVRRWKFPKGGLEAAEITVPLLFVPKGMDPDTVVQWERKVRGAQEGETSTASPRVVQHVSTVDEHTIKSAAAVPHSDRTKTTHSSTLHFIKPKAEEKLLISFKINRPVGIRENPRFSSKKVHEADSDTQLSILENRGDWLKVKIADAGSIGFVRKEFVSPIN
jgi:hypothetical protein